jgi:CelD/BcsL family acetyltransferase involved in cellulose biosynthesis
MWAWWRHAAPRSSRLKTVVVSSGDDVVGIAPLFVESRLGVNRYRILGAGVSSRVGFLACPGKEPEVAAAIAACLADEKPRPDAICFEGIHSGSPWPGWLASAWPVRSKPRVHREYSMRSPVLRLAHADFDEWFDRKGSHFRARMRRGARKLESLGGIIRLVSDPRQVDRYVSEFSRLHRSRWARRGGSGVLTNGVESALREAASCTNGDSPVQLWIVESPAAVISVQVFLACGSEMSHWLGGFDEEAATTRPGPAILTMNRVIEWCFANGMTGLDLGAGNQAFKHEFAEEADDLDWLTLCLSRVRCPAVRSAFLPARARAAMARQAPPGLKKRLRRLQRILYR